MSKVVRNSEGKMLLTRMGMVFANEDGSELLADREKLNIWIKEDDAEELMDSFEYEINEYLGMVH